MKKSIILIATAASLGLLATSCDPVKEGGEFDVVKPSDLMAGATFKQCAQVTDEDGNVTGYTESATGNYIYYNFPSVNSVVIYKLNEADGSEFDLSKNTGDQSYKAGGMFALIPSRGSNPEQTVYFRYITVEGDTITASKKFTVDVPADISPELKLLTSNATATKTWTWDTNLTGGGWGNGGYQAGTGDSFVAHGDGTWWSCPPEDLSGQMQHAVEADKANAAKDANSLATMVFDENGTVKCYDADGNEYRSGTFSIENWNNGERDANNWSKGTLKTSEGATLWPYIINENGKYCTEYEILELNYEQLVLVYDHAKSGGWGECCWWRFKSNTDYEGMLTNNDKAKWTWDASLNGGGWGNAGYKAGTGEAFVDNGNGTWWACAPADLTGQLSHAVGGKLTGAEDPNAYMYFHNNGLVESFKADGTKINGTTYEVQNYTGARDVDNWSLGTLHTGENSILWPFEINAGGKYVTDFEIIGLTSNKLILVYDHAKSGGWGECCWWRFKKVAE